MFLSSIQVYIFCENVWRCDILTHYTRLSIPSFLSPKFGWVHKFLWHCVQERKELLCGRILSQLQKQTGGDRALQEKVSFLTRSVVSLFVLRLFVVSLSCSRRSCIFGDTPATGEWLRVRAGEGVFPLDKIYRRKSSFQPWCQSVITKNFSPFQFKIWGGAVGWMGLVPCGFPCRWRSAFGDQCHPMSFSLICWPLTNVIQCPFRWFVDRWPMSSNIIFVDLLIIWWPMSSNVIFVDLLIICYYLYLLLEK